MIELFFKWLRKRQRQRRKKDKESGKIVANTGRGRPRLNRVPFNLQIDSALKEKIARMEQQGIIKRGAVTAHINEDLSEWLKQIERERGLSVG